MRRIMRRTAKWAPFLRKRVLHNHHGRRPRRRLKQWRRRPILNFEGQQLAVRTGAVGTGCFGLECFVCSLSNEIRLRNDYHMLERCRWRRRKGAYVWRAVLRMMVSIYRLPGAPMLANTCCTALTGASTSFSSSIPLPP
jgi:hypothetical protein